MSVQTKTIKSNKKYMEDLDKGVPKNRDLNFKQKSVLSVHFIACIIMYVLRLKSVYSSFSNKGDQQNKGNTMKKVVQIKDFSSFVFDLMTMNVSSMLMNSTTYFDNAKSVFSFAKNKFKSIREKMRVKKCSESDCSSPSLSSLSFDRNKNPDVDDIFRDEDEI